MAEKLANNEEPNIKKLKAMNPDVEPDDWETIGKPEEFLETESASAQDTAKTEPKASKTAGKAIPETIKEKPAAEKEEASVGGNIGKNNLLKDW